MGTGGGGPDATVGLGFAAGTVEDIPDVKGSIISMNSFTGTTVVDEHLNETVTALEAVCRIRASMFAVIASRPEYAQILGFPLRTLLCCIVWSKQSHRMVGQLIAHNFTHSTMSDQSSIISRDVLESASELQVWDAKGNKARFGDLFVSQKTIVVFISMCI